MTDKDFNEKCAEYLGWDIEEWEGKNRLGEDLTDTIYIYDNEGNAYSEEELHFNSDWNWIMLVIEAILDECSEEGDLEPYYIVTDAIPVLEDVKQEILNYFDNE